MVHEQILELLAAADVSYVLHRHPPLRTVPEVEAALPFLDGRMLKTIAFRKKDGGRVLAGLRGDDRIDYRLLAKAVGVNRRKIVSLSPDEVETELGFDVGGVAPFALQDDVTVLFDEALPAMNVVFCGSGTNQATIEIPFAALQRVSGGRLCPLARREDGGE